VNLRDGTRSAAKHQAILAAATQVFLDKGYQGASIDEVAALAVVGKQTVYKHFADKRQLFTEIVLATTNQVDGMVQLVAESLADTANVRHDLTELARRFLTTLMDPQLLRLRRLIIASAAQFPELGRAWYERGFERVLTTLADCFARLTDRGVVRIENPARAANHFVGMLLWIPLNRAMFTGDETPYTQAELHEHADAAVDAFLAAHGAPETVL
jgi:TetR/AcrR family transcriptional repressor of mexJK operon